LTHTIDFEPIGRRGECHEGRGEGDQLLNQEDHLPGGSHLAQVPVDPAGNDGVSGVELSLDPGSDGGKGVKPFGSGPEQVFALEYSFRDVVRDRIAQDVIPGLGGIYPAAGFADHHCEFRLMLNAFGLGRDQDWLPGSDHR